VCQQLQELGQSIRRYSKAFDAASLTPAQAAKVVKDAAAIEYVASAIKSLAVARASEGDAWKSSGYRSPADKLAHETGVSASAAKDILDTGRRMTEHPDVAAAALDGGLSPAQVSLVANGVEADPSKTGTLIQQAHNMSLPELRDEVARVKASSDLEARRRAIHLRRRLRQWTNIEGEWHLSAVANPEDGALIMAALVPIQREIFRQARLEGRREHPEAYALDSLVELARDALDDCPPDPRPESPDPDSPDPDSPDTESPDPESPGPPDTGAAPPLFEPPARPRLIPSSRPSPISPAPACPSPPDPTPPDPPLSGARPAEAGAGRPSSSSSESTTTPGFVASRSTARPASSSATDLSPFPWSPISLLPRTSSSPPC
jgi:hypothetical protein